MSSAHASIARTKTELNNSSVKAKTIHASGQSTNSFVCHSVSKARTTTTKKKRRRKV